MQEIFLGVFIFIGIVAVTALVFGGWVIGNISRALGRALGLISDRPPASLPPPFREGLVAPMVNCGVRGCGYANPRNARYCRHCGAPLSKAQSHAPRRTAMLG